MVSEASSSGREVFESQDSKWTSRGWSDSMTPEGVRRRLDKLEQLYQAWLELKRLRPMLREQRPQNAT